MYDGTISGNTATNSNRWQGGGGGNVKTLGKFEMHGGSITGNNSKYGGGLFIISNNSVFQAGA